jgi:Fic family protein
MVCREHGIKTLSCLSLSELYCKKRCFYDTILQKVLYISQMNNLSVKKFDFSEAVVSNKSLKKTIHNMCASGHLRKIASRLYTPNFKDSPASIVKRNLWQIVGQYFPSAILAYRTAIENKPAPDGNIYITSNKTRKVNLPGNITICPQKGSPPLDSDMPFLNRLYIPSLSRALLENLKPSRSRNNLTPKSLSVGEIEGRLFDILIKNGDLNFIRDQAILIASSLELTKELIKLERIIGTLLGTKSYNLESKIGQAIKELAPFDQKRADLFLRFHQYLRNLAPFSRLSNMSAAEWQNLSFFEGYFSNFIEGTEFDLEEAREITFDGKIPFDRPEDAHDIVGTYQVVSSIDEMSKVPKSFEEFIFLLKSRHATIMEGRPSHMPGEFKKQINRAGNTLFVPPELVVGTLKSGFELYQSIECPFYRAVFIKFIVAEVHPFSDGNGRLSRVMMNAELVANGEIKIIIPTVYRSNYLSSLKAISQNGILEPIVRVLDFAQKYTRYIDWYDFNRAKIMLTESNAFEDSIQADEKGIKLKIIT